MSCIGHFCSQHQPKSYNPDWMKNVKNKLISELTIPGTHDTCSRKNILEYIETQTWSFGHQLLAGIRFFDIRCKNQNNKLKIYHSFIYLDIDFDEILYLCKDFLFQYPTEALIMRVKKETKDESSSRNFQETFKEYVDFYQDIISMSKVIPKLDDIRGKIWIITDFIYPESFNWYKADIQDEYNIPSIFDIKLKQMHIIEQFEKAIKDKKNDKLYINFCSGYGILACFPWVVARNTNLIGYSYKGRLGIVVMDYPGEIIVSHLISQNYDSVLNDSEYDCYVKESGFSRGKVIVHNLKDKVHQEFSFNK